LGALKTFGFFLAAVALLLGCFYLSVRFLWGVPRYDGPVSDHFDGRHFHNPDVSPQRGLGRYLGMRLSAWAKHRVAGKTNTGWPEWVNDPPQAPPPARVAGLRVTFVNHATLLIQLGGLNILTDPQWSERASPVSWAGPKRHRRPGVRFEDLPPIDVVLLSHNHYDHMDLPTLRRLMMRDHPRIIAPLGNAQFLKSCSIPSEELDWWQSLRLTPSTEVTLVPARHFSARSLNDRNNALWGGFVVQSAAGSIYFAGDTAYGPHFAEIARRFAPIKLALIPIGAYRPRWFMGAVHLSPEEAVQAALDLKTQAAVPMHYGTFQLSEEAMDDPLNDLKRETKRRQVKNFVVLKPGEGKDF
jgi:L-ascorbate metabolism protein UlaG (beta-lactamase superfamily)